MSKKLNEIGTADIRNFIEGNLNAIVLDGMFNILPEHVKEQASLREKLCDDCLQNGSCPFCGCDTPNMFYAPKKTCPKGKWKEMLNVDNWNLYKRTFKEFINEKTETDGQEDSRQENND